MASYVRFRRQDGSVAAGLLEGDRVVVVEEPFWERTVRTGEVVEAGAVRLLAPCAPRTVVCVGLNYASHLHGRPIPDPPTLFFKPLSSLAGPGDDIVRPAGVERLEPEGEIVVVVGRELQRATREEAEASIFGYTAGNDVSAREWQAADGQWWRAKGSDTFGVFGPSIGTGLRHNELEVVTRVNGVELQRGASRELILDIPEILRYISQAVTLLPGDIVYTGTPGDPQQLRPGDVVEVEVTGAGVLRNTVVAG